jgi:hypothetical protein
MTHEFKISHGSKEIGTLVISKRSLVWFSKGQKLGGFKIDWKGFDRLMKKHWKSLK